MIPSRWLAALSCWCALCSACRKPFVAAKFLEAHPQFEWMTGLQQDRPSQPWSTFMAGE